MYNPTAGRIFSKTTSETTIAPVTSEEVNRSNKLFSEAIRSNWNLEMDWLWLATKVTLDNQRQYCLEKALYINSNSKMAKRALRQLKANPGKPIIF